MQLGGCLQSVGGGYKTVRRPLPTAPVRVRVYLGACGVCINGHTWLGVCIVYVMCGFELTSGVCLLHARGARPRP